MSAGRAKFPVKSRNCIIRYRGLPLFLEDGPLGKNDFFVINRSHRYEFSSFFKTCLMIA